MLLCAALGGGVALGQTPIKDIQDDSSGYQGQTLTIEGVVTAGFGSITDSRTSVYVQDDSGRGINVFSFDAYPEYARGTKVSVTGQIDNYQANGTDNAVTEIKPSSGPTVLAGDQPLPAAAELTTGAANDAEYEGTYVKLSGWITDFAEGVGGGTNIGLTDADGEMTLRIWDVAGLDFSGVDVGDSISALGIVSPYRSDFQLVVTDQSDLRVGGPYDTSGGGEPVSCDNPLPIASIQDSLEIYNGKIVTIRGIVTVGYGLIRNDYTSIYVQDDSGRGINVFDFDPHADLVRGTEVCITGAVEDYVSAGNQFGTTELTNITELTVLSTGNPLPESRVLTVAEVNDFQWDGTLVTVNGWVSETPSEAGGGWNVNISDGSGSTTVRVWDTTGLGPYIAANVARDQLIQATGIGSVYNDAFQVLLSYEEDLQLTGTAPPGLDTLEVNHAVVKIPRPLFAPRAGEKLRLIWNAPPASYVWIQVFDLAGRSVATLLEGPNTPPYGNRELYWDGRDRLNQALEAGTYLLHIRASQPGGGSITHATAPIVIGARLD